ncbi:inner membrane protein [Canicola haemoglobinophilus]|uniref:Inner membrane protein n=1 Tax=Canicola haemoglobinophilus TaxID=733 RepID=A0AB38H817_9PAST|nr:CidB/LrgB family autolysis modulator [Canicola haemoglobinophilus]STO53748.1 inner membrane protein [Canicola haemoglobinophilus]STO68281.1 inner membrane protein [Canicola haemoglobinophilus]
MMYFYSLLTVAVFAVALLINKRWKSVVFNSFVLTLLMLIVVFLIFDIPFERYYQGNKPINHLLGLSIIALALPLYEQLPQIRKHWQIILFVTCLASLFSMFSGVLLAILFGATPEIAASIVPKSVTTAIATVMAENLGGIPSVTAVGVLIAGLQGAILGRIILQKLGVKNSESQGLAIGAISHALGTVSCMDVDPKAGSYSSIALVLCGIISSLLAPLVFWVCLFFIQG